MDRLRAAAAIDTSSPLTTMQAKNGFEAQARKQRVVQAVSAGLTSAEGMPEVAGKELDFVTTHSGAQRPRHASSSPCAFSLRAKCL
jgi:hypothetical protein